MNFTETKRLITEIEKLNKQLDKQKQAILKYFQNNEGTTRLDKKGLVINYYPKSSYYSVDTEKLKKDKLYNKYTKIINKKDYIKIEIK